ncbi:unnamed protein product [Adineta steineri]|uniref:Uncharacterized protein n=1 Tax=Adineta steineri TaxID=433720 RepID=A0A813Y430_9BILA|nr:unnamed protein product [Adineta steineri]
MFQVFLSCSRCDPHIDQLHTTKAVTCELLENRTYISNASFKITGISKRVAHPDLTATAITSLQIYFYNLNGNLIAYYRASNGKLPLELIYRDPLSPSIIKIDHGERHSTEELLLNNSNGYLITGCSPNGIIDRQAMIVQLKERSAQSQRQLVIATRRQRRHILLHESQLLQESFASFNATPALRVNEIHLSTSRERRQLVKNDNKIVKEFKECYKQGITCQTMPDPDGITDRESTNQISFFIMVITLLFGVITKSILNSFSRTI